MNNDIVIIGAGPAGLTAAIYSARGGMDTLITEKMHPGGQLWQTERIENYPGFPEGILASELALNFKKQAENFGVRFMNGEAVKLISDENSGKIIIETDTNKRIECISVIIASGVSMKKLSIEGEEKYAGRGVSYCAVCDGPLYKDKIVAVVGGGHSACEEAVFLAKFAKKVYIIHRRNRLRATGKIIEKLKLEQKIELLLEKEINEIRGGDFVESIKFKNGSVVDLDGVFIFIGFTPETSYLKGFVEMENGFIKTDNLLKTTVLGVFSAGDCRLNSFRQVICAAGEGAFCGEEARKYIQIKKGIAYNG